MDQDAKFLTQKMDPLKGGRSVSSIKYSEVIRTDAVGEENIYHAEISRENYRNKQAEKTLAFMLSVLASERDFMYVN